MCMAAEWGLFGVLRRGVLGCFAPSPPAPLPLRGRGEDFEFFEVLKAECPPSPLEIVQLSSRMAIRDWVKKNDLRVDFVFAQNVRSQNKITQHGGQDECTSVK